MNVTHDGQVYLARELGALLHLEAAEQPPMFICSKCGEGASIAEKIRHKPSCPEMSTRPPTSS